MYHLKSVRNTNFCISDTPVFINHLIRMETVDIREFPPEVSLGHFFDGLTKCSMPWVDEKISIMPYIALLIFLICKGAETLPFSVYPSARFTKNGLARDSI